MSDFDALMQEAYNNQPWYRKLAPWLPSFINEKDLRVCRFTWVTIYHRAVPCTKKHFIDMIYPLHRKWYHPPIGVQIWY